jgi:phosphatidylinositol 4-kinase A
MVALPFEVFTPSAIAAGIETWTWVISERPAFEIAMMAEINTAWMTSIRLERGIFSKTLKYAQLLPSPKVTWFIEPAL